MSIEQCLSEKMERKKEKVVRRNVLLAHPAVFSFFKVKEIKLLRQIFMSKKINRSPVVKDHV